MMQATRTSTGERTFRLLVYALVLVSAAAARRKDPSSATARTACNSRNPSPFLIG